MELAIRASINYVVATASASSRGNVLTAIRASQITALNSHIAKMPTTEHTQADATRALNLLTADSPFTESERDDLGRSTHARVHHDYA